MANTTTEPRTNVPPRISDSVIASFRNSHGQTGPNTLSISTKILTSAAGTWLAPQVTSVIPMPIPKAPIPKIMRRSCVVTFKPVPKIKAMMAPMKIQIAPPTKVPPKISFFLTCRAMTSIRANQNPDSSANKFPKLFPN